MSLQHIARENLKVSGLSALASALLLLSSLGPANCSQSHAATILGDEIPLSEFIDNPSATITVGDKQFSRFGYQSTGDMPQADDVNVIPIADDDGNFGLRFQGAFVDVPSSPGGSDALITYDVEVADPNPLRVISDAHLIGNPALLGDFGSISVTETFLPLGGEGEFTLTIFDDESVPTPVLTAWVDFVPPVRGLSVQKDILAIATQDSQTATMSFVDQTFSQTIIPEPASFGLAIVCSVGAAIAARRRQR